MLNLVSHLNRRTWPKNIRT